MLHAYNPSYINLCWEIWLHHVIALLNDVAAAAGVQFTTCSVIDLTEWCEAVPAGAMWSSGLPRSDCNCHVLSIERRHLPLHPK